MLNVRVCQLRLSYCSVEENSGKKSNIYFKTKFLGEKNDYDLFTKRTVVQTGKKV